MPRLEKRHRVYRMLGMKVWPAANSALEPNGVVISLFSTESLLS
jgi:hypothetical protein